MLIKTSEFYNAVSAINTFHSLSKFFSTTYKEYVRMYSIGDGKLYLIVNNCEDIKLIQYINIDTDIYIDKLYRIFDMNNFIKNILNYSTFYFDIENNKIVFDDGVFILLQGQLSDDIVEDIFTLNKLNTTNNFIVDNNIEKELNDIFSILTLKAADKDSHNSFFYSNNNLFFNFKYIYVKKQSIMSFIITDIYSLRMISILLLNNKKKNVNYGIVNNKLIFESDTFYLETNIYLEDINTKNYLESYFDEIVDIKDIEIKLEFFNFVNAINIYDDDSVIVFRNDIIFINSSKQKNIGFFKISPLNIDFDITISTDVLYKILNYYLKSSNIDSLKFKIVSTKQTKFVYFKTESNVEILTEVI